MHSCDHSFYGSTRSNPTTNFNNGLNNNNKNRTTINNLNYSLSQLNDEKANELAKHCSVSAIACGPSSIGKAIASPEFNRESPLISSVEHHLDHHQINHQFDHHLTQSYHLVDMDQSIHSSPLESKFRNKNLKRSATLAECNWPIDDHHLDHLDNIHSVHSDIYQPQRRNAQFNNNKKASNCVSSSNFNMNKNVQSNLGKFDAHSSSTGRLNASSLATVIAAHNKFIKLKNFARTNQSFKSLPPAR